MMMISKLMYVMNGRIVWSVNWIVWWFDDSSVLMMLLIIVLKLVVVFENLLMKLFCVDFVVCSFLGVFDLSDVVLVDVVVVG